MKDRLIKASATFFYAGLVPVAPGTMGSFVGLLLFLCVYTRPWLYVATFLFVAALGFFSARRAGKLVGRQDPGEVVIDEVGGIFLVFFMVPVGWVSLVLGFVLYRALDVFKPYPARRLERLPGSLGIMSDDLLCGVYTNLILHGLIKLNILH